MVLFVPLLCVVMYHTSGSCAAAGEYAEQLRETIRYSVPKGKLAAFFVEPIQVRIRQRLCVWYVCVSVVCACLVCVCTCWCVCYIRREHPVPSMKILPLLERLPWLGDEEPSLFREVTTTRG